MKDFLSGILALISITAFILFIIGLFKPQTALFWYKKPRTKKASALINGLLFLFTSYCCDLLLPPPPPSETPKAAAPTPAPATIPAPSTYNFQLAKVEHDGEKIECNLIMDNVYPKDALIEKTRQLRDQYKPKSDFTCAFFYKRYADQARCMALFGYKKNCNTCEERDRSGEPLYADYTITLATADTLRALKLDTAGFHQDVAYLTVNPSMKHCIFSSSSGEEAFMAFQSTDGYSTYPLVKKSVNGQERFYDPNVEKSYFYINRQTGFVEYYEDGELDYKQAIED